MTVWDSLPPKKRAKFYAVMVGWYVFTAFVWTYGALVAILLPTMRQPVLDCLNSFQKNQDDIFELWNMDLDEARERGRIDG